MIYAVVWGPQPQHRIVASKAEGRRAMTDWRAEREARGWKIESRASVPAYISTDGQGNQEAISLHAYDPQTKQRVFPLPMRKREISSEPRQRRTGRREVLA